MSFVNPNTWHLICNNFNLNFIFGIVCLCVCVCAFSLRRESPDMILGDKPLISEVVLSHSYSGTDQHRTHHGFATMTFAVESKAPTSSPKSSSSSSGSPTESSKAPSKAQEKFGKAPTVAPEMGAVALKASSERRPQRPSQRRR
jgi:hypothetical protein